MANLDLSFYTGIDSYSDGDDEENYIYNVVKSGKTLEDIPENERTWPVFYHLTPIRENICNWYPFKKNATILEIGAGCGAITGVLCQNAAKVTAVELSHRRASINYERNKQYENLNIIVGNLNDIRIDEKFDYVTVIGVLEYAGRFTEGENPFRDFLMNIKRYLKPNGALLLAIENRLGLKYFSGAQEDHTGRIFEGINNYPHYDGVKTFSKSELTDLLKSVGLNNQKFYYPYPDYKLPTEIFTDYEMGRKKRPYNTYDVDRYSLFYEANLHNALQRECVETTFANSFFVEASELSECDDSIIYAKLNQERKEQFRVGTVIFKENNELFVKKAAFNKNAMTHLNAIDLNDNKSYGIVNVIKGKAKNNGIIYPFVKAETLEHRLANLAFNGERNEFISVLTGFFGRVFLNAQIGEYSKEEFCNVFGNKMLQGKETECVCPANIDLSPANVFCANDDYSITDCEWVFDFAIPTAYIKWRAIRSLYVNVPEIVQLIKEKDILAELGITGNWLKIFQSWEEYFIENYVCSKGQGVPKKIIDKEIIFGREEMLNDSIECLEKKISLYNEQKVQYEKELNNYRNEILSLEEQKVQYKKELNNYRNEVLRLKERVNYLVGSIDSVHQHISYLSSLKSFKLMNFRYRFKQQFLRGKAKDKRDFFSWLNGHIRKQEDKDPTYNYILQIESRLYGPGDNSPEFLDNSGSIVLEYAKRIDVITPGHTMYLANQIASCLEELGIKCAIHEPSFYDYEQIPYIVICPQIMPHLPEYYVAYQMEQTINSRWLTEKYMEILKHAQAVLDYSLVNVEYFNKFSELKKKLFYVPMGASYDSKLDSEPKNQKYEVLFYGDIHCERRQRIIDELKKSFNVHVESNLFGEEMLDVIRQSKVVINIHYYEGAMLETPRIAEILSLGTSIIVSERSTDQKEEKRMEGLVDFVDVDDIEAMKRRITFWLNNREDRSKKLRENKEKITLTHSDAKFYFERFLLAYDVIDFDTFFEHTSNLFSIPENKCYCLHLPEDTEREEYFRNASGDVYTIFPGIKHSTGWVGCAMSYKYIFSLFEKNGVDRAIICEDDVVFPEDFNKRLDIIMQYLENNDDWDVFSGFMASIKDDTVVLDLKQTSDEEIIFLNRMVSTVFNIYNKRAITIGSRWDYDCREFFNTIDRYFETFDMRIALVLPFLVGHNEDLQSTLWGKSNAELYDEMTKETVEKIKEYCKIYSGIQEKSTQ